MENKSDLNIGIFYSKASMLRIKNVPPRDNKIHTPLPSFISQSAKFKEHNL